MITVICRVIMILRIVERNEPGVSKYPQFVHNLKRGFISIVVLKYSITANSY